MSWQSCGELRGICREAITVAAAAGEMGEYCTVQNLVLRHCSVVYIAGWFNADSISIMMQMLIECSGVASLFATCRRHFSVWTEGTYEAKWEQGNVILVSR